MEEVLFPDIGQLAVIWRDLGKNCLGRLGKIAFPCLVFGKDGVTSGDEGMYLYCFQY